MLDFSFIADSEIYELTKNKTAKFPPSCPIAFSVMPDQFGHPYPESHRQVAGGINRLRRLAEAGTGPFMGPVPPSDLRSLTSRPYSHR